MNKLDFYRLIARMDEDENGFAILDSILRNIDASEINLHGIIYNKLEYLFVHHYYLHNKYEEINNPTLKIIVKAFDFQLGFFQLKYCCFVRELSKVIHLLEEDDIKYSVIKGISIINDLYLREGIVYRGCNDIDLLITKKNTDKVKKILNSLGYIQGNIERDFNIKNASRRELLELSLNSHQEHAFIKRIDEMPESLFNITLVDINTSIFEGGNLKNPIETEEILNNIQKVKYDNVTFSGLVLEYHFMQICYHFYKDTVYEVKKGDHSNYCLIKFCDIREFIIKHSNSIDWTKFSLIVEQNGISMQVCFPLFLIEKFYRDSNLSSIINNIDICRKERKNKQIHVVLEEVIV